MTNVELIELFVTQMFHSSKTEIGMTEIYDKYESNSTKKGLKPMNNRAFHKTVKRYFQVKKKKTHNVYDISALLPTAPTVVKAKLTSAQKRTASIKASNISMPGFEDFIDVLCNGTDAEYDKEVGKASVMFGMTGKKQRLTKK